MKTIELVNAEQEVVTVIELEFITDWAMAGDVKVTEDYLDDFFAKVYIKGEGTTHFFYEGDGYAKENKPKPGEEDNFDWDTYEEGNEGNAYYHSDIAGQLRFMRNIAFVLEAFNEKVGFQDDFSPKEYEEIKKLNLLDGYTIVYNLD